MLEEKPGFSTPAYTATVGMWLFLAALTMLFAATILGYAIIRLNGPLSPQVGALRGGLPRLLWLSTALVLGASFTIHLAVRAARAERQLDVRRYVALTCAMAVLFVVVQAPCLVKLLGEHYEAEKAHVQVFGLIFVLILVHALHVVGGLVALGIVAARAFRGRYDHENFDGVKHAAMYWHFLDGVWMVMFFSMLALG